MKIICKTIKQLTVVRQIKLVKPNQDNQKTGKLMSRTFNQKNYQKKIMQQSIQILNILIILEFEFYFDFILD